MKHTRESRGRERAFSETVDYSNTWNTFPACYMHTDWKSTKGLSETMKKERGLIINKNLPQPLESWMGALKIPVSEKRHHYFECSIDLVCSLNQNIDFAGFWEENYCLDCVGALPDWICLWWKTKSTESSEPPIVTPSSRERIIWPEQRLLTIRIYVKGHIHGFTSSPSIVSLPCEKDY